NLGGGGFMLLRTADGNVHFIDYREKAPAAATANMYLDAQGNVIEDASVAGYKAIGVPGSVAGMAYAQQKFGKLSLQQVIAPAIKLAREGFALAWEDARDLRNDKYLSRFPESRRVFQRNGNYYKPGEILRQPELAQTLERIAANPDEFYHGAMARELAASIQKGGGLITAEDLAHYEVKERKPINPAHASASKDLQRPQIFSQLEQYAAVYPQAAAIHEPVHTTHYSVVDPAGNTVSVTTTLNDDFGSRVTAEGLGFLLNDEMD